MGCEKFMKIIGRQIKIYLPKEHKDILEKDLETFNLKKNLSGLCNKIFEEFKGDVFKEKVHLKENLSLEIYDNIVLPYLLSNNEKKEKLNEFRIKISKAFLMHC